MMQAFPSTERLNSTRLLVIGDLMIDRYLSGRIDRISPEAPVPVLKFEEEHSLLGGAANVAKNIIALGGVPVIAGIVGNDAYGVQLRQEAERQGLEGKGIVTDSGRPTIIKTRVTSAGQQLLRIDRESGAPIDSIVLDRLQQFILNRMPDCAGVVLSDYDKGLLTPALLQRTIDEARRLGLRVFVDPKGLSFDKYRGASFITPNRQEAEQAARIRDLTAAEDLPQRAAGWIEELDLEGMLITLGKEGLFIAQGRGEEFRCQSIDAEEREVFDVTGAGDTVIAAFSLLVSAGMELFEAARWANLAAGVVVGKAGAATVSRDELLRYAGRFEPWQRKVKTLEDLASAVDAFRRRGLRIVFTNGCFDLLHAGHIQLLQAARRLGDVLIVGLNSDESVRALKGEGRPVIPEKERLQILASLDCVDYLAVYSEPTPSRIIETLRPDILAKGANYAQDEVTGHEIVERYGGRIELVPIRSEISVSRLVNRIVQQFGREGEPS